MLSLLSPWHNRRATMDSKTFLSELRRRNVYKVATAYAVIAWLLFEAASCLLHAFKQPTWTLRPLLVLFCLGFVIIVFISWAFEATPEGLKRTENVSPDVAATLPSWSRQKFTRFIVATALLATALLLFDLLQTKSASTPAPAASELTNSR